MKSVAEMYYAELDYILNIFIEQLQAIRIRYHKETIVYIPHPRDINQRDREICEHLGVEYQALTEPVENYILSHADGIKAVYGYGSTALIVIQKILPQVRIVNIEFTYGKSVKKDACRNVINKYYRQSGMMIEQVTMPFINVKPYKISILQNICNLFGVLKRKIQKMV